MIDSRGALGCRLTPSQIGERLTVDQKTVQRWMAGRMPHPRHRYALAALLGQGEEYLWPAATRSETSPDTSTAEVVAVYAFRADVDVDPAHWWSMLTKARQQIDLLGYTLYFLPQQHPQLIPMLCEESRAACTVRLVLADPASDFVRLREEVADRLSRPDLGRWLSQVKKVRHCAHPVRLTGGSDSIDPATGEVLGSYSSSRTG